jgi:glycerol kinase
LPFSRETASAGRPTRPEDIAEEGLAVAQRYVLAIDQGTTSSRAVVYDATGRAVGTAAREFTQHYPQPGWVEHDAEEIWQTVAAVVAGALTAAGTDPAALAGIGLTNQRETTLIWDRATGRPVARALVWQDRRTTDFCRQHQADEPWLRERTGLVLDPYFSATKLAWLLDQDPARRQAAADGKLAFGTIDSFLIARLTGGKVHATDVSNASRTLLLNLHTAKWDDELCRYFNVPQAMLPAVHPSAAEYGTTSGLTFLPDGIPIRGVAGDQQAALFGQCCFSPGEAKCTYGTGAFFLLHQGPEPTLSRHRLVTTLAATIDERPQYALEGSVFVAGAAVQWLRDGLKLFDRAEKIEALAAQSDPAQPVLFVPALVGLGAPHWVPEARGVVLGLTRNTTGAELARAALEGVAFQVADLVEAANRDAATPLTALHVDGGMARNAWFLQVQSDILGLPVLQSSQSESTALGAAYLAGLKAGLWPDLASLRRLAQDARRFEPRLAAAEREKRLAQWRQAVQAVIGFYTK